MNILSENTWVYLYGFPSVFFNTTELKLFVSYYPCPMRAGGADGALFTLRTGRPLRSLCAGGSGCADGSLRPLRSLGSPWAGRSLQAHGAGRAYATAAPTAAAVTASTTAVVAAVGVYFGGVKIVLVHVFLRGNN